MSATNRFSANAAMQADGAWLVQDVRYVATTEGQPVTAPLTLTWADAIAALCSGSLGPFLDERLRTSPHAQALFWETPAFSRSTLSRPFEFVTLPAAQLARAKTDGSAFAAHFGAAAAQCTTATITNLSGDATLVIPCPPPMADPGSTLNPLHAPTHGHLGAFVHSAPAAQREA